VLNPGNGATADASEYRQAKLLVVEDPLHVVTCVPWSVGFCSMNNAACNVSCAIGAELYAVAKFVVEASVVGVAVAAENKATHGPLEVLAVFTHDAIMSAIVPIFVASGVAVREPPAPVCTYDVFTSPC
jgi:hypothetical protein